MKFENPFENIHKQFKKKNEDGIEIGKLPGAFQLPNAPVSAAPEPKPFRHESPPKLQKFTYN